MFSIKIKIGESLCSPFSISQYFKVEKLRFSPFLFEFFISFSVFPLSPYVYTASGGRTKNFPQTSAGLASPSALCSVPPFSKCPTEDLVKTK